MTADAGDKINEKKDEKQPSNKKSKDDTDPGINDEMQERKIQFIFWNSSNLIEVKRISVKVEHFESCMIVKESPTPTGDESDMHSDYEEEETIEATKGVNDGIKEPSSRSSLSALGALGNAL